MPAAVNTELGSGLVDTRAVKKLEPQEVADAIVDALKYPKFDVWVPKISNGDLPLHAAPAALGPRGASCARSRPTRSWRAPT